MELPSALERQLGKSDERPLRGKAIIPKGKLNHPAVSVLDAENIILINNPSLVPVSKMCLCAVVLPHAMWGEGSGSISVAPDLELTGQDKQMTLQDV